MANKIAEKLNQECVYHDEMYADKILSKHWLVRFFFFQQYNKIIVNIASKNVTQVHTRECKTRSFICEVNSK